MSSSISPALLSRLSAFVEARMGLHFPAKRWPDLQRGIRTAAEEFGFEDAESCVRWLLSAPLSRPQIEILAGSLTVGETYFFRDKKSFKTLEEHILPPLIAARRDTGRRLRFWSAGCCTGEEPYSLAILLSRLLPDAREWDITIFATDINPRFLQKAAEGVFSQWSFRDAPPWLQERYFTKTEAGRFALLPQIKRMVAFSYLNLAEAAYPAPLNHANVIDVILCRNVLIYLAQEQSRKILAHFYRSLQEGGWLSVSPAEASHLLLSEFIPTPFPDTTFYRKGGLPLPPLIGAPTAVGERIAPAPPRVSLQEPTSPKPSKPAPPAEAEAPPPPLGYADAVQRARDSADQGRLADALKWCDQAIAADRVKPGGHYLRATILQEQGDLDEAVRSLKRALYLDHEFVLAHFALGHLTRQQGKTKESQKHLANALLLLRDYPPDDILPESDGMTAGRLSEIIASLEDSGTAP